jgi:flagellar motility protein MotE (MotC chaperone)
MATHYKNTDNIWKNKAKERQIENKDLRKRLKEINQVLDAISAIFRLLKNKGLSKKSKKDCLEYLAGLESTKRGQLIKAGIMDYFAEASTIVKT